jgi:hypothetical protein
VARSDAMTDVVDIGTWEALIGRPEGIEHAWAIVSDGLPEQAVLAAMARAVGKYGQQDWTRWRFRAERHSLPVVLQTVHFVWKAGELQLKS